MVAAAPKTAAMTPPAALPIVAAAAVVVAAESAPAEVAPVATAVAPVAATAAALHDIAFSPVLRMDEGPQIKDVGRYVLSKYERGETHFRTFVFYVRFYVRQCRSSSRLLAFCIGLYRQTDKQTERQTENLAISRSS